MTGDTVNPGRNLGACSWPSQRQWILAFAVLLVTSTSALANAGTPLMWAGMLHLVFGNSFIGVGEGLVLAWVFKLRKIASMAVMIAANYASAWIGLTWLQSQIVQSIDLKLYNAWRWVWIMVGVSYLITLVLEWPFVALCFIKQRAWLRRSLLGCLLVQTISYVFLFGWYWGASGKGLYPQGDIVPLSEFTLPKGAAVYYIGEEDGNVHEFSFDTQQSRQVFQLGSTNVENRLVVLPTQLDGGPYGISARLEPESRQVARLVFGRGPVIVLRSARGEVTPSSPVGSRTGGTVNPGSGGGGGFDPAQAAAATCNAGQARSPERFPVGLRIVFVRDPLETAQYLRGLMQAPHSEARCGED